MTDFSKTTKTPYITFTYRYKTHEFGYTKELTDNSHQKLHDIISKLKHQGLGYRKISKKLNEMRIKSVTGKTFYPSLVSNMWRTIKRREEKLNRELLLSNLGLSQWNENRFLLHSPFSTRNIPFKTLLDIQSRLTTK